MKQFSFCRMAALLLLMLVGRSVNAFGQFQPWTPEPVNVTFKLEYDQSKFMWPFMQLAVWSESEMHTLMYMGMDMEASLRPGTYDLYIPFIAMDNTYYYVIKEQIAIDKDTTIVLNPESATNKVSVNCYCPDGSLMKLDSGYYDNTGNWVTTEVGNVAQVYGKIELIFKGREPMFALNFDLRDRGNIPLDFYVTDVSDRIMFSLSMLSSSKELDKWYVNYCSTDDVKSGVLENSPEDYKITHECGTYTPRGREAEINGAGVGLYSVYDGVYRNFTECVPININESKEGENVDVCIYSNVPTEDKCDNKLKLFMGVQYVDDGVLVTNPMGFVQTKPYYISGTPFYYDNDEKVYVNLGLIINGIPSKAFSTVKIDLNSGIKATGSKMLPCPPAFCNSQQKMKGKFGDNCPIYPNVGPGLSKSDDHLITYLGRYGESIDYLTDKLDIKQDLNVEDIYAVSYENTNIEVDGLPGKNIATAYWVKTETNLLPPQLTMLQFRDNEDYITDRFPSPNEGMMEFTAAVFESTWDTEVSSWFYDAKPVNVVVDYSPYNENLWSSLDVEEVPEQSGYVGWGYFYRASLKDVTGDAEKGWFDVRFTMTDETGNKQVQTISPAFRIDNMVATGVKSVNAGEKSVVARYGLDGKRVDALQKGINIVRLQNGEVRKAVVK